MSELKHCPFCGGEAEPVYFEHGNKYRSNILYLSKHGTIRCKRCGVELPGVYSRVSKAIESWNRRAGGKLICEITIDGEEILRKALDKTEVDGKTIAEWIELAKGYEQLKQDLATAKQELDAAVSALHGDCGICAFQQTVKCDSCRYGVNPFYEHDCWEWEGISPDTEAQDGNNATKG